MTRPGRLLAFLPIPALLPRLGLMVIAADRQQVSAGVHSALLWISSSALAVLAALAEVYIGSVVVSRRHRGLGLLWAVIVLALNALVVPLFISGLEAVPVWQILQPRSLELVWGVGLGLLSTLCVGGSLWADVIREEGVQIPDDGSLFDRIAEGEHQHRELEEKFLALQLRIEQAAAGTASPPATHSPCPLCGYWNPDQHKVAGHVTQCRKRALRSSQSGAVSSDPGASFKEIDNAP